MSTNTAQTISYLDDDEKALHTMQTPDGMALEMLRDAGVAVEVIDN